MPSLRNLIDHKAVDIHAKDDVYKHLEKTKQAEVKYDIEKAKLHSKLAPARKMLELVDQAHPIDENNGNPDNLQNPQLDNQGKPIPNQQAPVKPGIGQPQQSQQQQPVQQKKPAFNNANKTSTKDKLSKDKDSKAKAKGKGIEVHVKAENGDVIDQMNVKKEKKVKGDYHNNPGHHDGSGRGIGLSTGKYIKAGGPGSGKKPEFKSTENQDKLNKFHQDMNKAGFKYKHSTGDNKTITHIYEKKDALSVGGRKRASIFERSNGDHATNLGTANN